MTTKDEIIKQKNKSYQQLYEDISNHVNTTFNDYYNSFIEGVKEDKSVSLTSEKSIILFLIESYTKDIDDQFNPDNGMMSIDLFFSNYSVLKCFFDKAASLFDVKLKEKDEQEIIEMYNVYSSKVSNDDGSVEEIKICKAIVNNMLINVRMIRVLYGNASIDKFLQSSYFVLQLLKYAVGNLYEKVITNNKTFFDGYSYESYIKYKEDMEKDEGENSLNACREVVISSAKELSIFYNKVIGSMILKIVRDIKKKTESFSTVEDFLKGSYCFADAYIYLFSLNHIAICAAELMNISIDSIKEGKEVTFEKKEEICFSTLQQSLYLFDIHISLIMDDIKNIGRGEDLTPGAIGDFYNHAQTLILIHDRIIYLQCEHQK